MPASCMVLMVASSSGGKSTFAREHFKPNEILSSDWFRSLVGEDENDQSVNSETFEALHRVADLRLRGGRLTVVDATNLRPEDRAGLMRIAQENDLPAVALVLDPGLEVCQARSRIRPERANMPPHILTRHDHLLRKSIKSLPGEGFRQVHILSGPEAMGPVEVARIPGPSDKRDLKGPFDIIGDVHGCYQELLELLAKLGYEVDPAKPSAISPEGRKAIFLGDLCDWGPSPAAALRLVMAMAREGSAMCVLGDHDQALLRLLSGREIALAGGLDATAAALDAESPEFRERLQAFLESLPSHLLLDQGELACAHAGLPKRYQGRDSRRVWEFALHGAAANEPGAIGRSAPADWTRDYKGKAVVAFGHFPSKTAARSDWTIRLDTGCCFGGALTAWRYPEKELVWVQAKRAYHAPSNPLEALAPLQPLKNPSGGAKSR